MAKPPAPGGRKSKMPFDPGRGQRLKALIGNQEIKEFSRRADVGHTSIYGYIRGNPIGGIQLAKLSDALGVSQDEIINGPRAEAETDERSTRDLLRDLLAAQQELNATALRVERLLRDQRELGQPDTRHRSTGG